MISTHTLSAQLPWLTVLLDRIEQLLWGDNAAVDTSTAAFYVFKPFPSSLKPSQYKDWGQLQSKILSPFEGGARYVHLSHAGVCVWAVPKALKGTPETAMQPSLPDGNHVVKGASQYYQQRWQDGVMYSCSPLSIGAETSQHAATDDIVELALLKRQATGWAVKRNIDEWLAKPVTWLLVMAFLMFSVFVWQLGATGSHLIQRKSVADETTTLEQEVGDKLALQSKYQQQQSIMLLVANWQQQNGFLPQTLANVAKVVMQYDTWQADSIEWQGKRLVLLLQLQKADISTLVADLEQAGLFSEVAIRPHSKANTWTLEVVQQ